MGSSCRRCGPRWWRGPGTHSSCSKSAPGDAGGSLHNVCPNATWIPARATRLSFSGAHRSHLHAPNENNAGCSPAFSPMSPSGLLCHGNRRKLLDMPARNFWIPRNYSHWMYSEVWVGFFFLHLRLFIVCTHSYVLYAFSNVWPCRLIVAI